LPAADGKPADVPAGLVRTGDPPDCHPERNLAFSGSVEQGNKTSANVSLRIVELERMRARLAM
jgi:hypothetical protein